MHKTAQNLSDEKTMLKTKSLKKGDNNIICISKAENATFLSLQLRWARESNFIIITQLKF